MPYMYIYTHYFLATRTKCAIARPIESHDGKWQHAVFEMEKVTNLTSLVNLPPENTDVGALSLIHI